MNQQVVHYKICLIGPGNEFEIRRLVIEKIVCHSFYYLTQKISTIYSDLKDAQISLYWKDREGDSIKICSDDELVIALNEMESDALKKIYVTKDTQKASDGMVHPGVVCDSCDHTIEGFRYKCLVCSDYDICSDCERTQAHPEHPMIRIPKPLSPEMPFGKRFAKELPKMSKHLACLFLQTPGNVFHPSEDKNPQNDKKIQFKKFRPYSESYDIIANKLCEKMRGLPANKLPSFIERSCQLLKMPVEPHPLSHSNAFDFDKERQHYLNVLTNGLSINYHTMDQKRDDSQLHHEALQSAHKEQKQVKHEDSASTSVASVVNTTAESSPTSSKVFSSVGGATAAVIAGAPPLVSQIDEAPVPADPTPVLQAQLTPPISVSCAPPVPFCPSECTFVPAPQPSTTYVPNSNPKEDLPYPLPQAVKVYLIPPGTEEDAAALDASWAVINCERTGSLIPTPVDSLERNPQESPDSGSPNPQLAANIGPVEATLMRLKSLGYKDEEWLHEIVENKKGNIKEVLKFLSPIPKAVSTRFLEFD